MRSTVGPHPPAVYWRRRAVVLGAVLLVLIVFFVSCGGGDDNNNKPGSKGTSQAPTPAPASSTPEEEPSFSEAVPGGGGPAVIDPDASQSPANPNPNPNPNPGTEVDPSAGAGTNGNNSNVTAPRDGSCADQEMSVTPVPASTTVKRDSSLDITLKIKNISARSCTRDLGAGAQELYIDQGARKYWSSDTCNADRSGNVLQLEPGAERTYKISWNGRQTSKCNGAQPAGPSPPAGQYELRGRLGTKVSEPVILTIAA